MNDIHLFLIGDELLNGKRQDLHLRTIARDLSARGAKIDSCCVIRDDPDAVRRAVTPCLQEGNLIITTGGLGPTLDDLTREVLSEVTGVPLEPSTELWEDLKKRYERSGKPISESNRCQALIPQQGTYFPNLNGTAPGLVFEPESHPGCCVVALPGPPRELNPMWHHQALPYLEKKFHWSPPPYEILMRFAQIGESSIDEKMRPLMHPSHKPGLSSLMQIIARKQQEEDDPHPTIGLSSLIRIARVDVTISLPRHIAGAITRLREVAAQTCQMLSEYVYHVTENVGEGYQNPMELEEVVIDLLRHRGEKLAVAESCTGGLLGKQLTDFPGSSDVFLGGFISYHNSLKENLLGVSGETLITYGAVSEETVTEMASKALERTGADWSLVTSGIAGPGGGTTEKPVGLVWIGIGSQTHGIETVRYEFPGDREAVRERAVVAALRHLWLKIKR